MYRLLLLVFGLLILAGSGVVMTYRQIWPETPVALAPTAATPPGPAPALALAPDAGLLPRSGPAAPPVPEPQVLLAAEPALPEPEPEPAAEPDGTPSVRHGAEGLSGSGRFSCAIEAGVRRCRSD